MGVNAKNHRGKSLKGSKLLDLFRSFSKKEREEAAHFLYSFYETKRIECTVFAYLNALRINSDRLEEELDLSQVFYIVHDRIPKGDKELLNLQNSCSDLYGYLMKFLIWKEVEENSFEADLMKLRALKKRELNKEYLSQIKRLSNRKEKEKKKDFWYPLQLLMLKDLHYYTTDIEKFDQEANIVPGAMELLDEFYFTAKLKYSCELLMREKLVQEENEILLLEEVFVEVGKREDNEDLTNLYCNALKLLREGTQEDFERLYAQVKDDLPISKNELFILVGYLINYSARLHKKGDARGTKQSFDLYKFGLKRELFTIEGYFADVLFLNIVITGCLLGAYLEISHFIELWSDRLNPNSKEETLGFSLAILNFAKEDYESALDICSNLNPKNVIYKIQSRVIEIKSCFELKHSNQKKLYRKCDQFEKFLKQSKTLGKNSIESGLNFLRVLKLLLHEDDTKKLSEELDSIHNVFSRKWLRAKIEGKK